MASKVHQVSRAPRALVGRTAVLTRTPRRLGRVTDGPRVRTVVLGNSGLYPRPRKVDQMSRVTRAWVRRPAGSTRCPG